jgi:hypothetical protein
MYTFTEIEKIFNSCKSWVELQQVSSAFEYLIKEDWIKSKTLYNSILKLCDQTFRRLENL